MVQFYIPVFVFFAANLWGLFSEIPSTTIQPTRPIFDRALGSLQLASTVSMLQPLVASWSGNPTMNWSENIDSTPRFPTEEDVFHQKANVTWQEFLPHQATRTDEADLSNGGSMQTEILEQMLHHPKAPSPEPRLESNQTLIYISTTILAFLLLSLMRQNDQIQINVSQWQNVQYVIGEIGELKKYQYEIYRILWDLHLRIPSQVVIPADFYQQWNNLQDNVANLLDGQNKIKNKIEDFIRKSTPAKAYPAKPTQNEVDTE